MTQAEAGSADLLETIAGRFHPRERIAAIRPLGNGNVNDTYLVTLAGEMEPPFVLQRLNTRVFRQPRLVMANMLAVGEHVARKLRNGFTAANGRRWEIPQVLKASDSQLPWVEEEGNFWRAISFIEAARSIDVIGERTHAREVGVGLGMFHLLIHDLPAAELADTLEGFHVTPGYLAAYHRVLQTSVLPRGPKEQWCIAFIGARESLASVLEDARARGELQLRPIHGDPKINNVMLDRSTGRAIALVDLDTVKPGLVQYDIGDCLRSGCNPLGEESRDPEAVCFDVGLCEAILEGYLSLARDFLTPADYAYIVDSIRLIAFELGLRFFSDHLAGNVYFKADHPQHNLDRALVQFRLTESIESQDGALRELVERLR